MYFVVTGDLLWSISVHQFNAAEIPICFQQAW